MKMKITVTQLGSTHEKVIPEEFCGKSGIAEGDKGISARKKILNWEAANFY